MQCTKGVAEYEKPCYFFEPHAENPGSRASSAFDAHLDSRQRVVATGTTSRPAIVCAGHRCLHRPCLEYAATLDAGLRNPGRYQNNNGTGSLATAECRLSENGGPAAKRQHPGDCKSADVSCLPTALTSRYRLHTILPLLSKIQSDVRVRLGTTYEHVVRSGPLQRLGVISNRSVNQTGHAGMTDSNPARPSHRNIARFRHFK